MSLYSISSRRAPSTPELPGIAWANIARFTAKPDYYFNINNEPITDVDGKQAMKVGTVLPLQKAMPVLQLHILGPVYRQIL